MRPDGDRLEDAPPPARFGSAAPGAGDELLAPAVELPWDGYLGDGASAMVAEGCLGLVRHAYPATAARDLRRAGGAAGLLRGDAADRERLGAVALGVAAAHHRPARMPSAPGEEPFAWWIAEETTLVWMPWESASVGPYGLELLTSGQASAVVVIAPDACWTVFRSGLPRRGASGRFDGLPPSLRAAIAERGGAAPEALARARWRRVGDTIAVRWRQGDRVRRVDVEVNRPGAAVRHQAL